MHVIIFAISFTSTLFTMDQQQKPTQDLSFFHLNVSNSIQHCAAALTHSWCMSPLLFLRFFCCPTCQRDTLTMASFSSTSTVHTSQTSSPAHHSSRCLSHLPNNGQPYVPLTMVIPLIPVVISCSNERHFPLPVSSDFCIHPALNAAAILQWHAFCTKYPPVSMSFCQQPIILNPSP